MKKNLTIPAELLSYAMERRSQGGSYEEIYASVLERAFAQHQVFLNASNLREIVGGGSLGVAQRAVDTFRSKLHERLSYAIDLGPKVPEAIARQFAEALASVWDSMRAESRAEWEAERSTLSEGLGRARAEAETARVASMAAGQRADQAEAALQAVNAQRQSLQVDLDEARAGIDESIRTIGRLQGELDKAGIEKAALTTELAAQAEQHKTVLEGLVSSHRDAMHDANREFMLRLDKERTEHRADLDKLGKDLHAERERAAAQAQAAAKAQTELAAAQQQLAAAQRAQAEMAREMEGLRSTAAAAREAAAGAQARLDEALRSRADVTAVLLWAQQHAAGQTPDASAWSAGSPEASLISAIGSMLAAARASKPEKRS